MADDETESGRVRAWILIRTSSSSEEVRRLYDDLGHRDDERFVLVRADMVDDYYNLVVPVDAQSSAGLEYVLSEIRGLIEVRESAILRVEEHNPFPPHEADGYITAEEKEAYRGPDEVKVGRQRNSPGMNPWG